MRKFVKPIIFLILAVVIFFGGYFTGHKIGRMFGAQQYTKRLWSSDEMQLSGNKILAKINEYRASKNLSPFKETIGLCKVARERAKEAAGIVGSKWAVGTQTYEGVQVPQELHKTGLTPEQVQGLCPECILETMGENAYISVRPEPCLNLVGKEVCVGGEEFGVVENYTDRVVNGWINSPTHNELLLSSPQFGCVGTYGGVVMLEVAKIK